jgi:hypothetical protein
MNDKDTNFKMKYEMLWGALDQLHAASKIVLEQGLDYQNRKLLENYLNQAAEVLKR